MEIEAAPTGKTEASRDARKAMANVDAGSARMIATDIQRTAKDGLLVGGFVFLFIKFVVFGFWV
jgi:hypothetical protein